MHFGSKLQPGRSTSTSSTPSFQGGLFTCASSASCFSSRAASLTSMTSGNAMSPSKVIGSSAEGCGLRCSGCSAAQRTLPLWQVCRPGGRGLLLMCWAGLALACIVCIERWAFDQLDC